MLSRTALAAATTGLLALATGCGASHHTGGGSTDTPSVTAPSNATAATSAIKADWTAFFSSTTSEARSVRLLQDGTMLHAALAAGSSLQAKNHVTQSAAVTRVRFTSPTTALVTYRLLSGDKTLLNDASGESVLVGSTWTVSKATFCSLVSLGSTTKVPGC